MAFRWRYLDATGAAVAGPDEEFDDQRHAEDWFGAIWSDLRDQGVHGVTLLDGDTEVYGPMSLHEA